MEEVLSGGEGITSDQNRRISEALAREQSRLRRFIRKRVPDQDEAEDIFQEVFYELVDAYRLMKPVEQVGAWLFRVARNRIVDLFRSKRPSVLGNDSIIATEDGRNPAMGGPAPVARRRTGSRLRASRAAGTAGCCP